MSLPLSSSSETTSLQLKKDMYMKMKETTATKTDILVNANTCNHSPVEERLKLPDGTNQGMANGSVDNGLCCDSVNGVELCNSENDNLNESRQGPFSHSLITNCDSEIKSTETATSCTVSDCGSNVSQVSLVSDSDIVIESSGDADLSGKSSVLNNDNNNSDNIERLIDSLGNTSLRDCIADENDTVDGITYVVYKSEKQMPDIMRLITKDLSEPYSIYTYRYFIHNWPKLCFLAMDGDVCIGAIVCKLDLHKKMVRRGYIAMLAVDSAYRRRKLGSTLVTKAIKAMIRDDCDEVVLETEITNQAALRLYENLGFVRDKRLFRYYLNGVDALRLKLWLR